MSQAPQRKTALAVALLSMGLAAGAMAQTGTGATGATGATSGSNTSKATESTATSPAGAATASTTAPARGASDAKLAHGDRKFVEDAAKGGMAEVQLGQLAAQKAQSDDVKKFGQRMVDDHGKANDKLKQIGH